MNKKLLAAAFVAAMVAGGGTALGAEITVTGTSTNYQFNNNNLVIASSDDSTGIYTPQSSGEIGYYVLGSGTGSTPVTYTDIRIAASGAQSTGTLYVGRPSDGVILANTYGVNVMAGAVTIGNATSLGNGAIPSLIVLGGTATHQYKATLTTNDQITNYGLLSNNATMTINGGMVNHGVYLQPTTANGYDTSNYLGLSVTGNGTVITNDGAMDFSKIRSETYINFASNTLGIDNTATGLGGSNAFDAHGGQTKFLTISGTGYTEGILLDAGNSNSNATNTLEILNQIKKAGGGTNTNAGHIILTENATSSSAINSSIGSALNTLGSNSIVTLTKVGMNGSGTVNIGDATLNLTAWNGIAKDNYGNNRTSYGGTFQAANLHAGDADADIDISGRIDLTAGNTLNDPNGTDYAKFIVNSGTNVNMSRNTYYEGSGSQFINVKTIEVGKSGDSAWNSTDDRYESILSFDRSWSGYGGVSDIDLSDIAVVNYGLIDGVEGKLFLGMNGEGSVGTYESTDGAIANQGVYATWDDAKEDLADPLTDYDYAPAESVTTSALTDNADSRQNIIGSLLRYDYDWDGSKDMALGYLILSDQAADGFDLLAEARENADLGENGADITADDIEGGTVILSATQTGAGDIDVTKNVDLIANGVLSGNIVARTHAITEGKTYIEPGEYDATMALDIEEGSDRKVVFSGDFVADVDNDIIFNQDNNVLYNTGTIDLTAERDGWNRQIIDFGETLGSGIVNGGTEEDSTRKTGVIKFGSDTAIRNINDEESSPNYIHNFYRTTIDGGGAYGRIEVAGDSRALGTAWPSQTSSGQRMDGILQTLLLTDNSGGIIGEIEVTSTLERSFDLVAIANDSFNKNRDVYLPQEGLVLMTNQDQAYDAERYHLNVGTADIVFGKYNNDRTAFEAANNETFYGDITGGNISFYDSGTIAAEGEVYFDGEVTSNKGTITVVGDHQWFAGDNMEARDGGIVIGTGAGVTGITVAGNMYAGTDEAPAGTDTRMKADITVLGNTNNFEGNVVARNDINITSNGTASDLDEANTFNSTVAAGIRPTVWRAEEIAGGNITVDGEGVTIFNGEVYAHAKTATGDVVTGGVIDVNDTGIILFNETVTAESSMFSANNRFAKTVTVEDELDSYQDEYDDNVFVTNKLTSVESVYNDAGLGQTVVDAGELDSTNDKFNTHVTVTGDAKTFGSEFNGSSKKINIGGSLDTTDSSFVGDVSVGEKFKADGSTFGNVTLIGDRKTEGLIHGATNTFNGLFDAGNVDVLVTDGEHVFKNGIATTASGLVHVDAGATANIGGAVDGNVRFDSGSTFIVGGTTNIPATDGKDVTLASGEIFVGESAALKFVSKNNEGTEASIIDRDNAANGDTGKLVLSENSRLTNQGLVNENVLLISEEARNNLYFMNHATPATDAEVDEYLSSQGSYTLYKWSAYRRGTDDNGIYYDAHLVDRDDSEDWNNTMDLVGKQNGIGDDMWMLSDTAQDSVRDAAWFADSPSRMNALLANSPTGFYLASILDGVAGGHNYYNLAGRPREAYASTQWAAGRDIAGALEAVTDTVRGFSRALGNRAYGIANRDDECDAFGNAIPTLSGLRVWADYSGMKSNLTRRQHDVGYKYKSNDLDVGADYLTSMGLGFGAAFGYSKGDFENKGSLADDSKIENYSAGLYAGYTHDSGLFATVQGSYTWNKYKMNSMFTDHADRNVPGMSTWDRANFDGDVWSIGGRIGYDWTCHKGLVLTPSIGVYHYRADTDRFSSNYRTNMRYKYSVTEAPIDLTAKYEFISRDNLTMNLIGTAGYAYNFNNKGVAIDDFGFVGTNGISGDGTLTGGDGRYSKAGRSSWNFGGGVQVRYRNVDMGVHYDYYGRKDFANHSLRANVGMSF